MGSSFSETSPGSGSGFHPLSHESCIGMIGNNKTISSSMACLREVAPPPPEPDPTDGQGSAFPSQKNKPPANRSFKRHGDRLQTTLTDHTRFAPEVPQTLLVDHMAL